MTRDRITRITVRGLRPIEDAELRLGDLTVLIGENGTGKSSLIEACEIIRRAAKPGGAFWSDLAKIHHFPSAVLRFGSQSLSLGVHIAGGGDPLDYSLELGERGVLSERLTIDPPGAKKPRPVIDRSSAGAHVLDQRTGKHEEAKINAPGELVLTSFGVVPPHDAIPRMISALENIEVHASFDVLPAWVVRSVRRNQTVRGSQLIEPTERLALLGENLANAYYALQNEFDRSHWSETMEFVRMGLGDDVESVNTRAEPEGGNIALRVKYKGWDKPLTPTALSDGTLAYLAIVALVRLSKNRSLLAFDEPELHLHPKLLARALGFFESLSRRYPVLLATHSDRLLDALDEPEKAAVLCELDSKRATRLLRADSKKLKAWLQKFGGLGEIRGAGHETSVMTEPESPKHDPA